MRKSLLIIVVCFCLGSPLRARNEGPAAKSPISPENHTGRVINGSVNPEMIADYSAYSMLFRFISNLVGDERTAIRAYLRQIFADETQINILIGAGEEFCRRAHPLDVMIANYIEQAPTPGVPGVEARIAPLRQEKERICSEIITSLVTRLGPTGAEKVRLHVEGMKRKMKVVQ